MTDHEMIEQVWNALSYVSSVHPAVQDHVRALARQGAAVRWRPMASVPLGTSVLVRGSSGIRICPFYDRSDTIDYTGWLPLSALEQTP